MYRVVLENAQINVKDESLAVGFLAGVCVKDYAIYGENIDGDNYISNHEILLVDCKVQGNINMVTYESAGVCGGLIGLGDRTSLYNCEFEGTINNKTYAETDSSTSNTTHSLVGYLVGTFKIISSRTYADISFNGTSIDPGKDYKNSCFGSEAIWDYYTIYSYDSEFKGYSDRPIE
jgi:hypothetical protein